MQSRMLRVNPTEPRRKRQIILLLSAILIPTAVLITFAIRLARQDAELAEKRIADERREAMGQLGRELSARLETIKLQELNRLSNEFPSQNSPPADFPVLFVAPLNQNRLIPPWETSAKQESAPTEASKFQTEG